MRVEIVSETVSLKGKFIPTRSESSQKVSDNQFLANFRAALSGKDSFFPVARFHRGFRGRSGELLEEFFVNYHKLTGKEYRILDVKGPGEASRRLTTACEGSRKRRGVKICGK
jgi:hypothetical protein